MAQNLIMRTVLITPKLDTRLRTLAFEQNKSKNEVIRHFLEEGLKDVDIAESKVTRPLRVTTIKRATKEAAQKKTSTRRSATGARSAAAME